MNNINIENSKQVVENIVSNLNSTGFCCIDNVLSDELQKEFSDEVIKLVKLKGKRYFSVVNVMSDDDLAFKAISNNNKLTSLLTSVAKAALDREVSKSDSLSVLRVVTGQAADTQSLKFHYDAFALTALIPIIIPDGPLEKSGHLVTFTNLRKFRSLFFFNLVEKIFFQNSFLRMILSKLVISNLEKYTYLMRPGNIYLFWGYRSLHANLPVDPDYIRATMLYHFGDVHPKSIGNKFIKSSRHTSENVNADKN